MDIAKYIVTDRATGRELVRGTAQQCAAALGVACDLFSTMAHHSEHGGTRYHICRINVKSKAAPPYPCTGCMKADRCDYTGKFCDAWHRWFTFIYANAARQLRAAARKRRANGESN